MNDRDFLCWLEDRIIHVYGENPNVDYLIRLRKVALKQDTSGYVWRLKAAIWILVVALICSALFR